MSPSDGWGTADEWFAEFIERLEASPRRVRFLLKERIEVPARVEVERAYQDQTEQLRRMIAVERERWLAEQRSKTA